MSLQAGLAEQFRMLHHDQAPLLLANVWDPLSAAIAADAGLPAVATASAAVALSRGHDDGEKISIDELVQLVERIAHVVAVPISVDIEQGYGKTADDVAESASRLIAAGAVGVNIEDSVGHDSLRDVDEQCERIDAVRRAGRQMDVPVFINARTDAFMMSREEREGLHRLAAYVAAGADGVYPILCNDLEKLGRVHTATERPINVLMSQTCPSLTSLLSVGVRRISMGPGLLSIAAGATRHAVERFMAGTLRLDELPLLSTSEMRRIQDIEP